MAEPFKELARATAKGKKIPDLPIIVVPPLYDQLPEEKIREDIRLRLPNIMKALTDVGVDHGSSPRRG